MNDKIIKISKPFSESYTLVIESATLAISLDTFSKVQIRYNFSVIEVNSDSIICSLIKTEQKLIETNNPIVNEIQQVSSVFGRMYNDIKVRLDFNGKVLEVLNLNTILGKWKETKSEMQKFIQGNLDLENSISLNDQIFEDPKKIKVAVEAQEFFSIYFSIFFGVKLPIKNKAVRAPNLFSTALLDWNYNIDAEFPQNYNQTNTVVKTLGKNDYLNIGFNNKAYIQFKEYLNLNKLDPIISEESEHIYRFEDGKLEKASISKTELVEEGKVSIRINYQMVADSFTNR